MNIFKKIILLQIVIMSFILLKTEIIKAISVDESYLIKGFVTEVNIEKDSSLTVKETITVNFKSPKHGIYRVFPVYYTNGGKTINSRLKVMSVTDEKGRRLNFEKTKIGQSLQLKIGDAEKTYTGDVIYIISYKLRQIIQRYEDNAELYINITGHDWDTDILHAQVLITSPYADIEISKCFAGEYKSNSQFCTINNFNNKLIAETTSELNPGDDFSIVMSLKKANGIIFPSKMQELGYFVSDNWGYLTAFFPIILIGYLWRKRGRDFRYISENIYFEPDDKNQRMISIFERIHIPYVYHPIDKITPGEAGTIVDEKVHISDVVAEILELARMGFISVRKIETEKHFYKNIEYAFIKTDKFENAKERDKLKDFQDYLLKELFRSTIIHNSVKKAEDLFKNNDEKLAEVRRQLINKDYVLLSGVKNHFYEGLSVFKNKIYERMKTENIFDGNPEKIRLKWVGVWMTLNIFTVLVNFVFLSFSYNYFPFILQSILFVPGIFISLAMPRRTAKGYSFFRQIKGLKWYIEKGEWRYKIAEKYLFIEEILPLAVALGVVDKISKDMKELGIKPPSYFKGSSIGTFSKDLAVFNNVSSASLLYSTSGKVSGSSSWSGGSGFSGHGFSGGGFGGGGGRSW